MGRDHLAEAATSDDVINIYDYGFIFKDLFLSCVPQLLSSGAVLAITFGSLTEVETISVAAIASPSGALALNRTGQLEKIVSKKKS